MLFHIHTACLSLVERFFYQPRTDQMPRSLEAVAVPADLASLALPGARISVRNRRGQWDERMDTMVGFWGIGWMSEAG